MTELLECLFSCDLRKLKEVFEKLDVNCVIPGTDGCTPLHVVAGIENFKNKENIISFLLEKGADPNARSYEDLTPVHIAAMWDNCFQLEKLLQNCGNPWLTDKDNKNSFDMAADNYAYEAFQLLNMYLAEDKLNCKVERPYLQSPRKVNDDSQHCQFEISAVSKPFANTTFVSANENFPLILSSLEDVLNFSKCIKRISKQKIGTESKNLSTSENSLSLENQKSTTKKSIQSITENKSENASKNHKNNLNNAYFFSSTESETSDFTSATLNNSDDSHYETIVDADKQNGIALVEIESNNCDSGSSNLSVSSVSNSWKTQPSDCSTLSYCSSHSKFSVIVPEDFQKYSNSRIYQELLNLGDDPGPVLDHTRQVYLLRLARLRSGCKVSCQLPKPKYCPEVYQFLENKLDMERGKKLEQIMAAEFDSDSGTKWREGNQRCCFNYFLLDPRVTQNLPSRASSLSTKQKFLTFLDALFYVGKGSKGRPYSHLIDAAKSLVAGEKKNDKFAQILDIWEANLGVISLHCFQNSKPVEAYTREASIIEAVGLANLTNVKKGDFYGSCSQLTPSRKRLIGISLLDRALKIFLFEGERQIKPKDVQK